MDKKKTFTVQIQMFFTLKEWNEYVPLDEEKKLKNSAMKITFENAKTLFPFLKKISHAFSGNKF